MRSKRIFAAMSVSLLLTACATSEPLRPYVAAYPGSYMDRQDVALVHVPAETSINTVNGYPFASRYKGREIYVALAHGENTLTISAPGASDASVTFYAQGGRNYNLQTSAGKVEMVDVTDRPGAWCHACYLEPWTPTGTIADPGGRGV